jgi:hypothetical protein
MTDLRVVGCEYADWIRVAQDKSNGALINAMANLWVTFKVKKVKLSL